MSKIFQAFLSGVFFTFILDFFLILAVKINYIDTYNIKIYYNILFADNQNIYIFAIFTFLIGFVMIYTNKKVYLSFVGALFVVVFMIFIPDVGYRTGEYIFMKKGVKIQTQKFKYFGDIIYNGRDGISFKDYELKKIVLLKQNKIKSID